MIGRENAIVELQNAFDSLPTRVSPSLKIREVYVFGSLPRGVKKTVHDIDMIVVLDNMQELCDFSRKLNDFLIHPNSVQKPVRDALLSKYRELHKERWRAKERCASNWPSLHDFLSERRIQSVLQNEGLHPNWLGLFTWNEICMSDFPSITLEKLLRRAFFGFKRGFQIIRVESSVQRATEHLATSQLVLAWSPAKPNVEQNLTLDRQSHAKLVRGEHENMWEQLQTVQAKNTILMELCRYHLSQLRSKQVQTSLDRPPREVLMKCIKQTGITEKDLVAFLDATKCTNLIGPITKIPSLKVKGLPDAWPETAVEDTRSKLRTTIEMFRALLKLKDRLRMLIRSEFTVSPAELPECLAGCVPKRVATDDTVIHLLDALGVCG